MKYSVKQIKPIGFGYGSGTISLDDRKRLREDDPLFVSEKTYTALDAYIKSPNILVPVDHTPAGQLDDDGCGDGRGVKRIYQKQNGKTHEKARSLNRAKIFGGGLAMTCAALIATKTTQADDATKLLDDAVATMKARGIDYGAHTDDHASGKKSGCGAIDNAPLIIQNIRQYRDHIAQSIQELGIDAAELDTVLEAFVDTMEHVSAADYSGKDVMARIIDDGKVVKELAGDHREVAVILNTIPGQTVNQPGVRELTNDALQVFAVDVWRLQALSERLYDEYTERDQALLGMLVYTLSTAATLTKGDLPVYLISPKSNS